MSTSSSQSSSTLDGLPKQFVTAMRTLFDIMDDKRLGCVNVADIEARWQDDGSKGLPKGVIESLRKVTPPNGQLSFERFCAGLKICLLRNQMESQRGGGHRINGTPSDPTSPSNPPNRPPSAPLLSFSPPPPPPPPLSSVPLLLSTALPSHHMQHQHPQQQQHHNPTRLGANENDARLLFNNNNPNNNTTGVGVKNHLNLVHHGNPLGVGAKSGGWNTAAIRPNVVSTQRTLSMPQLLLLANPSLLKDTTNTNPPPTQPPQQIIQSASDNIQHHHRKSSYDSLNSKLIPMSTKPPPIATNNQQPPQQPLLHGTQQVQNNVQPTIGILYGPPKPPRAMDRVNSGGNVVAGNNLQGFDREGIRTALQNWQIGVMVNNNERDQVDLKHPEKSLPNQQPQPYSGLLRTTTSRSLGDGSATNQQQQQHISDMNSAINNLNHLNLIQQSTNNQNNGLNNNNNSSSSGGGAGQGIYQKKSNVRRREPRRHTLQNGIDYNMLKRMKQIEQEKEVLIGGLNAIEKARDWYMKQIAATQDKMKYLGRMGHAEHWSEAQQERLELQRARVLEVNRHLAALTDSWERGGLPLHMNLAVQHLQQPVYPLDCANRLKQQNRLLTEEVGKKTERISILEREKQSLIRELLQTRVPNRNSQEEAVF